MFWRALRISLESTAVTLPDHDMTIQLFRTAPMSLSASITKVPAPNAKPTHSLLTASSSRGSYSPSPRTTPAATNHHSSLPLTSTNDRTHSTQNRTLVIIMGNLRGGETAWRTLYKNVLDVNNADLALMIGKVSIPTNSTHVDDDNDVHNTTAASIDNSRTSSMYRRAKYVFEFDEYEDWGDAVDLINGTSWRQRVAPMLYRKSSILGGVKLYRWEGSGAVIFMIRWFLSNTIRQHNLTALYDRFIVTRSDHYYLCPHNLSELEDHYLWLPEGQNNRGVTDRHLVVNKEDLLPALDVLPAVLANPERYRKVLGIVSGNPEKILKQRWQELGLWQRVRRFPRMMFTCAMVGDTTRWKQKSDFLVPEGVHLKYLKEYNASLATCDAMERI